MQLPRLNLTILDLALNGPTYLHLVVCGHAARLAIEVLLGLLRVFDGKPLDDIGNKRAIGLEHLVLGLLFRETLPLRFGAH